MLDDFIEAKKGGICGIMGDRLVSSNEGNKTMAEHDQRSISEPASQKWYIEANNLYGYAMMRKLPYKDSSIREPAW